MMGRDCPLRLAVRQWWRTGLPMMPVYCAGPPHNHDTLTACVWWRSLIVECLHSERGSCMPCARWGCSGACATKICRAHLRLAHMWVFIVVARSVCATRRRYVCVLLSALTCGPWRSAFERVVVVVPLCKW
jgi:hypothetical protein